MTRINKWTIDANGDPYLDADCEKCGRQAVSGGYDEIDITRPGDKIRRFALGRQHFYCDFHLSEIQALESMGL